MQYDTPLKPHHRNHFTDHFPSISKPKIIGYFSIDQNRQYIPDHSMCKYLKLPTDMVNSNIDLNLGYELVKHKPNVNERLDQLLMFVAKNIRKIKNTEIDCGLLQPDIICFRGLLRLLMCTPYEYRDSWSILASNYKGSIYLCEMETEEAKERRRNETAEMKKFCSYGFKFEQYILADDPAQSPNTDAPVLEGEEFCCIFDVKLSGTRLLYGAEMDGIECDKKLDLSDVDWNSLKFVEVKVKGKERHYRQTQNFRKFKLIKWWCQSFLVGIEKIIYGERNERGLVESIQSLSMKDIPKLAKEHWTPAVCLKFCNEFLGLVKMELHEVNSAQTVFKFDWDPKNNQTIKVTKYFDYNSYSFLPEWYINAVNKV